MRLDHARRTLAAVAAGVLLLAPAGLPADASTPAATSSSATDCVKKIPVKASGSITPDGVKTALTPGLATIYYYDTGHPGDDGYEVVPPAGWTPLTATTTELRTYGFPPRPAASDGPALSRWTTDMSTWRSAGAPQMCVTDAQLSVVYTYTSGNWAGNMVPNGTNTTNTLWTTDNKWTQPAFSSSGQCSNGAYGVWGGLGGWIGHEGRLLQSGVLTGSNLAQYMVWDIIAPGHTSGAVTWTDFTIGGGDDLESWVTYDASSGLATLSVIDHTKGKSHNYTFSSYDGVSAAGYWDGTTAEVITEQVTDQTTNTLWNLLKPNTSQVLIYYATVNGQPIANFSSWAVQETRSHPVQTTNTNGASAFYDTWKACN